MSGIIPYAQDGGPPAILRVGRRCSFNPDMKKNKTPKLRTVNKSSAPYSLNEFPKNFPVLLGKELVYLKATRGRAELEGGDWERIFAECIGAAWKPSNVGIDDITYGTSAWGAKTLKSAKPATQRRVRLISGRNSPNYSFGERCDPGVSPTQVGGLVLEIWNERIFAVRQKFKQVRTVVLLKSNDLSEVAVFELETVPYSCKLYRWKWNSNGNLYGFHKKTGEHCFTWQPHGSQFTIIRDVPDRRLVIRTKHPQNLDKEQVLKAVGFRKSWIKSSIERG